MLSSLQKLHLYATKINGTIPREISMPSNLQELIASRRSVAQFSRDMDAEQFADIAFVRHAD